MLHRSLSTILVAAAMVWGIAFAGQAFAAEEQSSGAADKVAVVNGTPISSEDFQREVQSVQQRFASMGQQLSPPQQAELESAVLEKLIETTLLIQEARKAGVTVSEQTVEQELANLKQKFPDPAQYQATLAQMNVSEGELKKELEEGLTVNEFIKQKFVQKVSVTDEEAKAYYEQNSAEFQQPEMIKASHILVGVPAGADQKTKEEARAKIEELQQQLEAGADFAELAEKSSDCPSSAQGGDLGAFQRGQMVAPFEEAAFALEPGQVSDIVETQFGYHLIKLTEKKPASKVAFEEVKDRLKDFLQQQKVKTEVQAYLAELKEKAEIERLLKTS